MSDCLYVSILYVCSAGGGQQRATGCLELELQEVVSSYVGAGNGTQILCNSSQCCEPVSISPLPLGNRFSLGILSKQ